MKYIFQLFNLRLLIVHGKKILIHYFIQSYFLVQNILIWFKMIKCCIIRWKITVMMNNSNWFCIECTMFEMGWNTFHDKVISINLHAMFCHFINHPNLQNQCGILNILKYLIRFVQKLLHSKKIECRNYGDSNIGINLLKESIACWKQHRSGFVKCLEHQMFCVATDRKNDLV